MIGKYLQYPNFYLISDETSNKAAKYSRYQLNRSATDQDHNTGSKIRTVTGCYGQIINIECETDELVHILEDSYGVGGSPMQCQPKEGDCIVIMGQQRSLATKLCAKKNKCQNMIVTRTFCNKVVTSYQQIKYICVPGKYINLKI